MTVNQENKIRMFYAVSAVCECNTELWDENEAFAGNYKNFLSKISQIKQWKDQLLIESISMETFKSIDRVELEEFAYYLSGKLKSFAIEKGNDALLEEVNDYRRHLSNATDIELINMCSKLSNACLTNLSLLDIYSISSNSIADLQQLTSMFSARLNRTKYLQSKAKSTQENLKKVIVDADSILKDRLDKLIDLFENSDSEFYQQYNTARIIINLEASDSMETNTMAGMTN
jgi:hypothetical protein